MSQDPVFVSRVVHAKNCLHDWTTEGEKALRILTPSENKRLNELIGFVGLSLAILLTLSLLSYSPHDASFNVSAPLPGDGPARNWIGPVGAHLADLFFNSAASRPSSFRSECSW